MRRITIRGLICLSILITIAAPAMALSNRVFVKSTGMDVGTCPITSPCRSFSYAMTQVAVSGEIIALDTAGYGVFTIGQSVSVFAAPGSTAFIAVTGGGTGITISAGASDVVVLRGLALSSAGGSTGVDFANGRSLAVENCIVNGFADFGILMDRLMDTVNPRLRIENSTIRNSYVGVETFNIGSGPPTGGPPPGTAGLTIANSAISGNSLTGLLAGDNTRGAISDTVFSDNGAGVTASTAADYSYPDVNLERCTITTSSGYGILAGFGGSANINRGTIRIADNTITGNVTGVFELPDGKIMTMTSAGLMTNTIEGNASNGTLTGSYTAK